MSFTYPSLKDLQNVSNQEQSNYFGGQPASAATLVTPYTASAYSALHRLQQSDAKKEYPIPIHPPTPEASAPFGEIKIDALKEEAKSTECGFCEHVIDKSSFTVFVSCNHMLHLNCALKHLKNKENVDGGPDSCPRCAKQVALLQSASRGIIPEMHSAFRNSEQLLAQSKLEFRRKTKTDYDELKEKPFTIAQMRQLLMAPKNTPSFASKLSSIAPEKLTAFAKTFAAKIKFDDDDDDEPSHLDELLQNKQFTYAMCVAKRTFDDIIWSENGSLLSLYRCGVRSLIDLENIGFDHARHLNKEYKNVVPLWQMFDLYKVDFVHMIRPKNEGGWGLPLREIVEHIHFRPSEWAMLGASMPTLVAMGLTNRDVIKINMKIDQWQRYLEMERAHLTHLSITTRSVFVERMKWDAEHEWCPKE